MFNRLLSVHRVLCIARHLASVLSFSLQKQQVESLVYSCNRTAHEVSGYSVAGSTQGVQLHLSFAHSIEKFTKHFIYFQCKLTNCFEFVVNHSFFSIVIPNLEQLTRVVVSVVAVVSVAAVANAGIYNSCSFSLFINFYHLFLLFTI